MNLLKKHIKLVLEIIILAVLAFFTYQNSHNEKVITEVVNNQGSAISQIVNFINQATQSTKK